MGCAGDFGFRYTFALFSCGAVTIMLFSFMVSLSSRAKAKFGKTAIKDRDKRCFFMIFLKNNSQLYQNNINNHYHDTFILTKVADSF
jgi:hypothetical protein